MRCKVLGVVVWCVGVGLWLCPIYHSLDLTLAQVVMEYRGYFGVGLLLSYISGVLLYS